ncbi:MAG TPA: hypothetical protein VGR00_01375 [Thermoanaerobaculia bacterium]|nr:hypothetical protein [Thermoanaerobaculia bacterium]
MSAEAFAPPADLSRVRGQALVVAAVATVLSVVGGVLSPTAFARAYLVAFVDIFSVAMGCLILSMIHHLSRGAWGVMVRRILEAAARTLPYLGVLFLPIVFFRHTLYEWARPEEAAKDPLLLAKKAYLNPTAWGIRAAVFFLLWTIVAYVLSALSRRQDTAKDPTLTRRMQNIASLGLLVAAATVTLAAVDWMMSLNPHWSSTIYGLYLIIGALVAAMAFTVLVALYLSRRAPLEGEFRPVHFHDYGKLLLAFVMVWAYFSVSQFLIVWSGNLPEETSWYQGRMLGGWRVVSLALVFLHFAFPFILLLSRDLKRDAGKLARVAALLLVMRWVDVYWLAAPAFSPNHVSFHWLDAMLPIALCSIWLWLFVGQLQTRPLLPLGEPFLKEALGHD